MQWAHHALEDWHLAEDAVQEAFLAAFENLHQLRDPAAFPGWFKRIVFSQCQRLQRRHYRRAEKLDAAPDKYAHTDGQLPREHGFSRYLQYLPEHELVVVRLFYWDNYSYREIGQRLGLPLSTVKKRLYSARQRLKKMV
ncbi:MAG: sigma-70 family RNA polymerase sigma factor [Candidatus Latescibacteria bacterium]|nr:sigma-70 family RNA polymerase sigma factor [Candidatus Latescibacterota bacterium]